MIVPAASAGVVSASAGDLMAREAEIVRLLEAGSPLSEALGARYEKMLEKK